MANRRPRKLCRRPFSKNFNGKQPWLGTWIRCRSENSDRRPKKYFHPVRKLIGGCPRLYMQDHSRGRRLTTTGQPTVSLLPLKSPEAPEIGQFTQNLGPEFQSQTIPRELFFSLHGFLPCGGLYPAARTIRFVGVSRDIGGISARSIPATNMGVGATLPQRFRSQRARINFTSGRSERSRTSFVVPR